MVVASLDNKVQRFYDEGYVSMLFTPVCFGWRRYGSLRVAKAFEYVLEEQLGLGNINVKTYNDIVTKINELSKQMASKLYMRKSLIGSGRIIADFRKMLEEDPDISEYLRYAQSKQYLMKANSRSQQNIAKEGL